MNGLRPEATGALWTDRQPPATARCGAASGRTLRKRRQRPEGPRRVVASGLGPKREQPDVGFVDAAIEIGPPSVAREPRRPDHVALDRKDLADFFRAGVRDVKRVLVE